MTDKRAGQSDPRDLYGEKYYRCDFGEIPYDRSTPHYVEFFRRVADWLVGNVRPRTALDVGCAKGFLVEALRDRGVEAWGVDMSEYAIGEVREDIRGFCRVGSASSGACCSSCQDAILPPTSCPAALPEL